MQFLCQEKGRGRVLNIDPSQFGSTDICQKCLESTVAVGTTITGRPPHRSVQARLRIRLLPWMGSGKACIRVGMQNAGLRNPPRQQRGETIPPHLCPLAATDENAPPQPANAPAEDAQLGRVTRNGMVLVVAQHNLAKPCTDRGRTMMLSAGISRSPDRVETRRTREVLFVNSQ